MGNILVIRLIRVFHFIVYNFALLRERIRLRQQLYKTLMNIQTPV